MEPETDVFRQSCLCFRAGPLGDHYVVCRGSNRLRLLRSIVRQILESSNLRGIGTIGLAYVMLQNHAILIQRVAQAFAYI